MYSIAYLCKNKRSFVRIVISGSTGFIGSALVRFFRDEGHEVVTIGREIYTMPLAELNAIINGADALINLAGAPIISRWTKKRRNILYFSRINFVNKLTESILTVDVAPRVFISASAIGIYSESGKHTESKNEFARNYLALICKDWEAKALKNEPRCRLILLRTGMVLGREGGAFGKLLPIFRLGLGGPIGSGDQGYSWIHIDDVVGAIDYMIRTDGIVGPVNLVSPNPVTNRYFSYRLAKALNRPAWFRLPAVFLALLYGEGATVITRGQIVFPEVLIKSGYVYKFGKLDPALADLVRK
ncbi:MAG: TIGR01777 family protein [Bacteroidales bacterium]|nr:TIGR01777 family protein [Bacteroidales bacterium]